MPKLGTPGAANAEHRRIRAFASDNGLLASAGRANLSALTTYGPLATKRATVDGIIASDRAKNFRVTPLEVRSLDAMRELLAELEEAPHTLLVAEPPRPDTDLEKTRRNGQTFASDQGRSWLFVDIDELAAPEFTDTTDADAVGEAVKQALPSELSDTAGILAFTSKAGLAEAGGKLRLRLVFRLDAPLTTDQMRAWAKVRNREARDGAITVDPAVYSRAQAIYTARPIFEDGRADPFSERSRVHCLPGARNEVAAADLRHLADLPTSPSGALPADDTDNADTADSGSHLKGDALDYISDDALGLHEAIRRAVWQRAKAWGGCTTPKKIAALAREARRKALAAVESGRLRRPRNYVEEETSVEAIRRSYEGALARGAGLRLPPDVPANLADAERKLRSVAANRTAPADGYTLDDYALAVARAGMPRLDVEFTPDELADRIDGLSGQATHPAIRQLLRDFRERTASDYQQLRALTGRPAGAAVEFVDALDQIHLEPDTITVVKAPFGTGKTQVLGRRFLAQHPGAAYFVHRRSLARSTATRLKLAHYQDREAVETAALLGEGIATVINSAVRTPVADALTPAAGVVLDEAEQMLRHLVSGAVPDRQKAQVFGTLQSHLSAPGAPVLALDAGMDDFTIAKLHELAPEKPVKVYELRAPQTGAVNLLRAGGTGLSANTGRGAAGALATEALAAVESGQRVVVATDSRSFAESLGAVLQERTETAGGVITSDTRAEVRDGLFAEPEGYPKAQRWQWLVYSPAIAAGVSFESGWFDQVLALYTGVVSPADFAQMLFRVRTVREWTLAIACRAPGWKPSARERRDALVELDRRQHEDRGRELDALSQLAAEVASREDADRAWYPQKLVAALQAHGLTINLRATDPSEVAETGTELHESAAENARATVDEILSAEVLDEADANALRRRDGYLTAGEVAALARWRVACALGLDEPDALTREDIDFYYRQRGKPDRAISAFDIARRDSFDWRETDTDQPAATRRFLAAQRVLFREFLESLGVDPVTGSGEWGRATATRALSVIDRHHDVATKLRLRGTGRGVKPQRAVASVLDRLGVTVKKTGSRRRPRWSISADSWATMLRLSARRGHSHGSALPQSRAKAEAKARAAFEAARFFDEEVGDDRLPRFLTDHFRKRSSVFLLDPQWIMDATGVSRATAYRRINRVRQCSQIDLAHTWRVALEDSGAANKLGEQIEAVSYLSDSEQVRAEVQRTTGLNAHSIREAEQSAARNSDERTNAATGASLEPGNAPPQNSDSGQITLAAIQRNAGLTSAKAGLYADRGRKFRRKLERSGASETVRDWMACPNTEAQRLIDVALGATQGDPAAAQKWIQAHATGASA